MTVKNFKDKFETQAQIEEVKSYMNKAEKSEKKYITGYFKDIKKLARTERRVKKLKQKLGRD